MSKSGWRISNGRCDVIREWYCSDVWIPIVDLEYEVVVMVGLRLMILVVGLFVVLIFVNEWQSISQDPSHIFNQIDHDQDQGQVEPNTDHDADGRPTPDLTKPGQLSAPPHIYADPNSGNECILGVPSDPNRPQRVNPHCA